jgi:hypothetical protein
MSIARITCDRCGAEVEPADRSLAHVLCGPLLAHRRAFDLCPSCSESLAQWLATPPPRALAAILAAERPPGR